MCEECSARREAPAYNAYSIKCVYCGARIIQSIRSRKAVPVEDRTRRAKAALADWVQWGHDEAVIRQLVATGQVLEPENRR